MTGRVVPWPSMTLARARETVAMQDIFEACEVLDACELLMQRGDTEERAAAAALHASIVRQAVGEMNRAARWRRRMLLAGDVVGVLGLFGLLFILMLLTP